MGDMRDILTKLHDLQELDLVLSDSHIVHRNETPDAHHNLTETTRKLRAGIPEQYLRRYDQLRRNGVAVADEKNGTCGACRLSVPIGDLNRMRRNSAPWVCPNCGLFLVLAPSPGKE